MSLDPGAFVDTSNWAGERSRAAQQQTQSPDAPAARMQPSGKRADATPAPGDIASLEQMLEPAIAPACTARPTASRRWPLIITLMLLLAAGAAAAVIILMT